jgi:internalin A
VTLVDVRGPDADDQLMSRLSKLPDLSFVEVNGGSVTDVGLGELAKGSSIRYVGLFDAATISDAGIAQLKSLRLSHLTITASDINGSGIAGLTSVRSLNVDGCARFSDASLAGLHRLKQLQILVLSSTGVTNDGMDYLVNFPELKQVYLDFTAVDDTGLVTLVRTCPHLEVVSLTGTAVTEAGIIELATLKHIEWVSIQAGAYSASAIAALKQELPAVTIRQR